MDELIERLRQVSNGTEGYVNAIFDVWGHLPKRQMYVDLSQAADRLSEQQQVIVQLAGYAQHRYHCYTNGGGVCNCGLDELLSRAKEAGK